MAEPTVIYSVEHGPGIQKAFFSTAALALTYATAKVGLDGRAAVPRTVSIKAGSETLWNVQSS